MTRFLKQLSAFLALQGVLLGLLLGCFDGSPETHYLASILDKHQRLKSLPSPRVILVGGSNVPFGIQSPLLERELRLPVVNMGLVARLGIDFMLGDVEREVRAGDIVLLSLEYDIATGSFSPDLLRETLAFRPSSLAAHGRVHYRKVVLEHGLSLLGDIVRVRLNFLLDRESSPAEGSSYARQDLNGWGDYVAHFGKHGNLNPDSPGVAPSAELRWAISPRVIDALGGFAARCERKGARCFYTCPPRPAPVWVSEQRLVRRLVSLYRDIPGVVVIDDPTNHLYRVDQLYDMSNHLTYPAARLRTLDIASRLKPFLTAPGDPTPAPSPRESTPPTPN